MFSFAASLWSSLLAGLLLGLAGGLSPGPLTALVLGESLRGGRAAGLRVAMAPLITDGPLILLALWVGEMQGAWRVALGLGGAGMLLYLAWGMWHSKPPEPGESSAQGALRRAVLTNLLNPHPYLFWLAVGGPMLASTPSKPGFLLGFFGALVGSKALLALLADRARAWMGTRGYVWTLRALAVALTALALQFAVEAIGLI